MSHPIVLNFGFDRNLFPRAVMAFWFSAVPRPSPSSRIIFWLLVWLAILAGVIAAGAAQVPPALAWAGAGLIAAVWLIALQRIRMGRFYNVLAEHWTRTGDFEARFDEVGMYLRQHGTEMRFDWSAVDDVVRTRGGTVFRIGMTMIAIPDEALPDGLGPKDFRTRLNSWRGA